MSRVVHAGMTWLVAVLISALTTAGMPHVGNVHHDADFDIVVVAHDASAHQVRGGEVAATPDHCLACHWGRSFKPGHDHHALTVPVTASAPLCSIGQSFVPSCASAALPPLRSPPAASLS